MNLNPWINLVKITSNCSNYIIFVKLLFVLIKIGYLNKTWLAKVDLFCLILTIVI